MRVIKITALVALLITQTVLAEENGWTWDEKPSEADQTKVETQDAQEVAESEYSGQEANFNSTSVDEVVDTILTSQRLGRNLDGFDEVYADPNLQDAIQKGDDSEARNIIKDRLCSLGLMQVKKIYFILKILDKNSLHISYNIKI